MLYQLSLGRLMPRLQLIHQRKKKTTKILTVVHVSLLHPLEPNRWTSVSPANQELSSLGLKDGGANEAKPGGEINREQIAPQRRIKGTLLNARLLARNSCQSPRQTSLFEITGEEICLSPLSKDRRMNYRTAAYCTCGADRCLQMLAL